MSTQEKLTSSASQHLGGPHVPWFGHATRPVERPATGEPMSRTQGRLRLVSAAVPTLTPLASIPKLFRARAEEVRRNYGHLYHRPVIEDAAGNRYFHRARLYRRHGLNILFLRGDYTEMALQHGRLLADVIPLGAPPQSARTVENAVANMLGRHSMFQHLLAEGIHRLITNRILTHASVAVRDELGEIGMFEEAIALSDATGVGVEQLVRGLFNPEVMLILANHSNDGRQLSARQLAVAAQVACHCTTFGAWGGSTTDGGLIVGRNLDYPLNGYFDRFPTVTYCEPTGGQRYMSFVSAGVHNCGTTAYNEAGIFMSSHTIPTTDVSVHGVPAFITANQAVRYAKTFDDVVDLFRRMPPPTGWGFFVSSTREGRVGTIEMSNRQVVVRPSVGDSHVQTNHFRSSPLCDRNLFLNTSVVQDIEGRSQRIQQRLDEARGRMDAEEAVSVLGDQVDPYVNETRGLGSTVGVHTTMMSVVLDAARDRVLVSTGPAPAPHHPFVELPLIGTFDRRDFRRWPLRVTLNESFRKQHGEKLAAMETFIKAKRAYEQENDVARAYDLLQHAAEQDPPNPAYRFQLGIFALKNHRHVDAVRAFGDILECPYVPDQLRRLAHYYRGRTFALLQESKQALADLGVIIGDAEADPRMRSAAQRAALRTRLLGGWPLSKRSLMIMMQHSDMLRY
ncbi:MAG: hypothetical protein K8T25_14710 [Planctomycetia bacterium]|nr:hypothetical protein [Planctomycetia bacterium]